MIEKMKPRGEILYVQPIICEYHGLVATPDKYKQTLTYGTVLAIGPNVQEDIKVGSVVYYSSFSGVRFQKDRTDSVIQLKDNEILSIKDEVNGVDIEIGEIGYAKGN